MIIITGKKTRHNLASEPLRQFQSDAVNTLPGNAGNSAPPFDGISLAATMPQWTQAFQHNDQQFAEFGRRTRSCCARTKLGKEVVDHLSVDIGQANVSSAESEDQATMVEPQLVQNCSM
jgi:hypothetical protein